MLHNKAWKGSDLPVIYTECYRKYFHCCVGDILPGKRQHEVSQQQLNKIVKTLLQNKDSICWMQSSGLMSLFQNHDMVAISYCVLAGLVTQTMWLRKANERMQEKRLSLINKIRAAVVQSAC